MAILRWGTFDTHESFRGWVREFLRATLSGSRSDKPVGVGHRLFNTTQEFSDWALGLTLEQWAALADESIKFDR